MNDLLRGIKPIAPGQKKFTLYEIAEGFVQSSSALRDKRIIFVLPSLEIGGAERQAMLLARCLAEQKARVEFWGLTNQPGKAVPELEKSQIPWRTFPFKWSHNGLERFKFLFDLGRALRKIKPDVIIAYTLTANVACGLVWRWTGARLFIWNQRGINDFPIGKNFELLAVRWTPVFVSNSTYWARFLCRTYALEPSRVLVIHNGIELPDDRRTATGWRSQSGIGKNCFVACMVANLTEYKDHPTLIRAWHQVIRELERLAQPARLVLAGSIWGTGESIRKLVSALDLENHVTLLGFVPDIPSLLQQVDLGILVSNSEGLSNAVLESMAAKLPVVATDIPGIREAVGSDYRFLVLPGSVEELADRILLFAKDAQLRKQVGEQNRLRVEREFSVQKMCEATTTLIAERLQR